MSVLKIKEHLKRLALKNKGRSRPEGSGKPGISISVFDTLTNERTEYPSTSEAARAIGVTEAAIRSAFRRGGSTV